MRINHLFSAFSRGAGTRHSGIQTTTRHLQSEIKTADILVHPPSRRLTCLGLATRVYDMWYDDLWGGKKKKQDGTWGIARRLSLTVDYFYNWLGVLGELLRGGDTRLSISFQEDTKI